MRLPLTGSQTVGPYFSIGMGELCRTDVPSLHSGEMLAVHGTLVDGDGAPVPDAVLEIWSADEVAGERGEYAAASAGVPQCPGFARVATAADGSFLFRLVKPGGLAYDAGRIQAPHVLVSVYMRGLLRNLITRMYFPDEALNAADPVLLAVPEQRRPTLIAEAAGDGLLRWNITLQGEGETVFFAW